jgi:hypothetical protein
MKNGKLNFVEGDENCRGGNFFAGDIVSKTKNVPKNVFAVFQKFLFYGSLYVIKVANLKL